MSFVFVRDRSRLGHKPDCRLGWLSEYVRKSMYAWHSVSVACRPAETRRRRGEIGSIRRSILVGHRRPNRRQRVNTSIFVHIVFIIFAAWVTLGGRLSPQIQLLLQRMFSYLHGSSGQPILLSKTAINLKSSNAIAIWRIIFCKNNAQQARDADLTALGDVLHIGCCWRL